MVFQKIDVVKLRQQLENVGAKAPSSSVVSIYAFYDAIFIFNPYSMTFYGFQLRTTWTLVSIEGAGSLYKGISAALLRSLTYGSLRLGLYEPFKEYFSINTASQPLGYKILSGVMAGSVATLCTNPIELIKVIVGNNTKCVSSIEVNIKKAGPNAISRL